ncbi:hypothetical protein FIBSPDRAFT_869018 [Athelia psychrophila]|uniref:U6 snRNA-associated Sm-like protein LSm4 n=1 Tax=Athelia psychrophila TaxID=1759441 RepID=A0A166CKC1_9AGAM|nr:hypothetical protein FIBSPDRAFT_869018 [Fibularhizoctonia sp. CBS 109695]
MNITLREVYQTNSDGDRFWKLKECYIRGSTIKYLRVPDTLLDTVKEEQARARESGRGGRGGSGPRGKQPADLWQSSSSLTCAVRKRRPPSKRYVLGVSRC